jgi:hypothetical protein
VFLDADTILPRNFISALVPTIPQQTQYVGTCLPLLTDLTIETFLLSIVSYPIGIFLCFLNKLTVGYCLVVSKNIHDTIGGFREDLTYAEDTEYGRRAMQEGASFVYFWKPCIFFSVRRLSKTGAIPWLLTKLKESLFQKGVADNGNPHYSYGIFGKK